MIPASCYDRDISPPPGFEYEAEAIIEIAIENGDEDAIEQEVPIYLVWEEQTPLDLRDPKVVNEVIVELAPDEIRAKLSLSNPFDITGVRVTMIRGTG